MPINKSTTYECNANTTLTRKKEQIARTSDVFELYHE